MRAERAGALPGEMRKLADQLNSVLVLENQLQSGNSSQLLSEINSKLASVDSQSKEIGTAASHRTMTEHFVMYSLGGIAAVLATLFCHYAFLLFRKSRAKRALGLEIVPKSVHKVE